MYPSRLLQMMTQLAMRPWLPLGLYPRAPAKKKARN
jgi:hypothetical protein